MRIDAHLMRISKNRRMANPNSNALPDVQHIFYTIHTVKYRYNLFRILQRAFWALPMSKYTVFVQKLCISDLSCICNSASEPKKSYNVRKVCVFLAVFLEWRVESDKSQ